MRQGVCRRANEAAEILLDALLAKSVSDQAGYRAALIAQRCSTAFVLRREAYRVRACRTEATEADAGSNRGAARPNRGVLGEKPEVDEGTEGVRESPIFENPFKQLVEISCRCRDAAAGRERS